MRRQRGSGRIVQRYPDARAVVMPRRAALLAGIWGVSAAVFDLSFGAIFAGIVGSGLLVWGLDRAMQAWKDHRRRDALSLVFEETDLPPFLIENHIWRENPVTKEAVAVVRRLYRIGVTAGGTEPIQGVRVLVEGIDREMLPQTLVLGYALRLADDNGSDAATVPPAQFASPVFYDFVEQYQPSDRDEPTDWAWICFRRSDEAMPMVPLGKTRVTLRVEASGGAVPKRRHFVVQTRIPATESPTGEVQRTKLTVRNVAP